MRDSGANKRIFLYEPNAVLKKVFLSFYTLLFLLHKDVKSQSSSKVHPAACGGGQKRFVRGHLALRQGAAVPYAPAFADF